VNKDTVNLPLSQREGTKQAPALSRSRAIEELKVHSEEMKLPVKYKNSFTHFCRDMKPMLWEEFTRLYPTYSKNDLRDAVQREATARWRVMSDVVKEIYRQKSRVDMDRYKREMLLYNDYQSIGK